MLNATLKFAALSTISTLSYNVPVRDAAVVTVAHHDCTDFVDSWSIVSATLIRLEADQAELNF